jgi:hypothetical protein
LWFSKNLNATEKIKGEFDKFLNSSFTCLTVAFYDHTHFWASSETVPLTREKSLVNGWEELKYVYSNRVTPCKIKKASSGQLADWRGYDPIVVRTKNIKILLEKKGAMSSSKKVGTGVQSKSQSLSTDSSLVSF